MNYLRIFNNILSIVSSKDKLSYFYLQILIFFSCFVELLNIFLLYIFTKILIDGSFIFNNKYILFDYLYLIVKENPKFFILIFLIITNFLSIIINLYINWKTSEISESIYQSLSNKLYYTHLRNEGVNKFSKTFSDYTKVILHDLTEIKIRIFIPLMSLNHKLFLVLFFALSVFILSPKIIFIAFPSLLLLYWLLFKLVKGLSLKIVNKINDSVSKKIKILNESFYGFKEILLLGLQNSYYSHFKSVGAEAGHLTGIGSVISYLPRVFIELLIILIVLLFLYFSSNNLIASELFLPTIVAIGLAGLKIIPAMNQVYFNLMNIRNGIFYLNKVKKEFKKYLSPNDNERKYFKRKFFFKKNFFFKKSITFKNIYLKYNDNFIIKNFTLKIAKNKILGIAGPSGAGKSSLIDLIIGFIKPSNGKFLIDNIEFNRKLIKSWQQNFFLVTQNVFLSNQTIAENIAFGQDLKKININKIKEVSKILKLDKIINRFPEKYFHKINDMGIGFSNGEKQRISLARALYFDKNFLILDEATNALDSISENLILNYIKKIKNKTVILITHRLKTLKFCDQVILLDNGSLVYDGSYQRLLKNKSSFKTLINLNS
jgi:HlyD family secretion protein